MERLRQGRRYRCRASCGWESFVESSHSSLPQPARPRGIHVWLLAIVVSIIALYISLRLSQTQGPHPDPGASLPSVPAPLAGSASLDLTASAS